MISNMIRSTVSTMGLCHMQSIVFFILQGFCVAEKVFLSVPEYTVIGDNIWVNCSSDVVPSGRSAEFLINGETIDSLRQINHGCFSAVNECSPEICQCSKNGSMFSKNVKVQNLHGYLYITCVMKFVVKNPVFKNASVVIKVIDKPFVNMEQKRIYWCNNTYSVKLECLLSGDFTSYGFMSWHHFLGGVLIRKLNGTMEDRLTVLTINSCSYMDAGDYVCVAWHQINGRVSTFNISSNLLIKHPPIIVDAYSDRSIKLTFSITYFTSTLPTIVEWFKNGKHIGNSSKAVVNYVRQNLTMSVYNKTIIQKGYISNLSVLYNKNDQYYVTVNNEYGSEKHMFLLPPGIHAFGLSTVILVLSAVVVFILTIGTTTGIIKQKIPQISLNAERQRSTTRADIYYAAPADENNVHMYNTPDTNSQNSGNTESDGHYTEIANSYEELDPDKIDQRQYEMSHDYIDIV